MSLFATSLEQPEPMFEVDEVTATRYKFRMETEYYQGKMASIKWIKNYFSEPNSFSPVSKPKRQRSTQRISYS